MAVAGAAVAGTLGVFMAIWLLLAAVAAALTGVHRRRSCKAASESVAVGRGARGVTRRSLLLALAAFAPIWESRCTARPRTRCPSIRTHYDDSQLRRILERVKTIAMVGASTSEMRPSYFAMMYLQGKGYRVLPVNPRSAGETLLGENVYPDLASLPLVPDMVSIFRRSSEAGAVADEAVRLGIPVVWMQLGVRDDAAAARAEADGCGGGHGPLPQDRIRPPVRRDRLAGRQSRHRLGQARPGGAAQEEEGRPRLSSADIRVVDLATAFASFSEHWSPRIAGDVNDSQVRLAKLMGEFVWHRHEGEDELFLVVKGHLRMRFHDREDALIGPGQFLIVPRNVEHLPIAEEEVHVVLVEPRSTLHTGDTVTERTVREFAEALAPAGPERAQAPGTRAKRTAAEPRLDPAARLR